MWPWTEIERLKEQVLWLENRDSHRLFLVELRENIALKAIRDLSAANKGIRRLKERIKRLERAKP